MRRVGYWITAKGRSRRPAMDVALSLLASRRMVSDSNDVGRYLFTPPASGDTITA